jgi:cell wall-associated NlpC family hydrolase
MADPVVEALIRRGARRRGLDPRAVLAVAMGEGGLRNRPDDIGDLAGGGSYGPFQLYAQGALPRRFRGRRNAADAWAWSPAGINYALNQIAKVARGQRGRPAIESIVTRFERPARPGASIEKAWGRYDQIGGGGGALSLPPARAAQGSTSPSPAAAPDLTGLFNLTRELVGLPPSSVQFGSLSAPPLPKTQAPQIEMQGRYVTKKVKGVVGLVQQYLGTPYVWGGEQPGGFDCSGLLQYVWGKKGVKIPRVTYDQWQTGAAVAKKELQPGDAVFFRPGPRGPEHVGMYIGGGRFVEAARRGTNVRISQLAGRTDYIGARRFA